MDGRQFAKVVHHLDTDASDVQQTNPGGRSAKLSLKGV